MNAAIEKAMMKVVEKIRQQNGSRLVFVDLTKIAPVLTELVQSTWREAIEGVESSVDSRIKELQRIQEITDPLIEPKVSSRISELVRQSEYLHKLKEQTP